MQYVVFAIAGLILGFVAWSLLRKPRAPALTIVPTYDGPIDQYAGGKTLLVAVHADWASVWPVTAGVLAQLDMSRNDLKLIDADQQAHAVRDLEVEIIPTVLVFRDGREIARIPNLTSADQLP